MSDKTRLVEGLLTSIPCFYCRAIKNYKPFNEESPEPGKCFAKIGQNQVCTIFHMRGSRKNVLPKFIKFCIETPCWCPFERHIYGQRKPSEKSVFEFPYQRVNSSLEELLKIKVIFILRQGMIRQQNLKKSVTF